MLLTAPFASNGLIRLQIKSGFFQRISPDFSRSTRRGAARASGLQLGAQLSRQEEGWRGELHRESTQELQQLGASCARAHGELGTEQSMRRGQWGIFFKGSSDEERGKKSNSLLACARCVTQNPWGWKNPPGSSPACD